MNLTNNNLFFIILLFYFLFIPRIPSNVKTNTPFIKKITYLPFGKFGVS